ncbi:MULTISPECIES: DUF3168 domain-containing protein [unclassified Yoonia]|uniref:DUF3168 domain-containing protein n=1 Tax=unclassified Yoonia TaxID=2629118 RepID=UPI002AFFDB2F|nr:MULTISPECIES: DUF3168 domain-containing protein [unclassified Yoonia]
MSYAIAAALQMAIYTRLSTVNLPVYDAVPAGALPPLYVLLGAEDVRDASDQTGFGADHALSIAVISEAAGFAPAKQAAAAICDALLDTPMPLTRGTLVGFHFTKARAARKGGQRQITLTFRARVADDT